MQLKLLTLLTNEQELDRFKDGINWVFLGSSSELHHFLLLPALLYELQFKASKMPVKCWNGHPGGFPGQIFTEIGARGPQKEFTLQLWELYQQNHLKK